MLCWQPLVAVIFKLIFFLLLLFFLCSGRHHPSKSGPLPFTFISFLTTQNSSVSILEPAGLQQQMLSRFILILLIHFDASHLLPLKTPVATAPSSPFICKFTSFLSSQWEIPGCEIAYMFHSLLFLRLSLSPPGTACLSGRLCDRMAERI